MMFQFLASVNSGSSVTPPEPGAEQFYVSESGTGTGVGSIADPFTGAQFLNLIDSGLPSIPPGSTILFNRGEIFRYQYDLDDDSINFSAYGTGDEPIISGSDTITGWTLDADDVYYASLATEPKAVFGSDDVELPMSETAWITITNRPVQTQISADQTTLQALDGVEELEGSYILCKEWLFRPCLLRTVTAYNGTTTLTVDAAPNTDASGAGTGMPFKLMNKRSYITDVGEWSYDATADRLYVKTSGGAPTGIKISTRDYGIKLSTGVSNISISNIKFHHQFLEGVYSTVNHNITVTQCKFHDLSTNASSFTGDGTNITYTYNDHQRVKNNLVHIGSINGGVFSYNTGSDIGVQTGVSIPKYSYFKSVGCGIHMRWDFTGTVYVPQNITCEYNKFTNFGYCPIVHVGIGHIVRNNVCDTFCIKWGDGAGIYVSNVYGTVYGNGSDTTDGIVSNNYVVNGLGGSLTLDGITGASRSISGIYLDNNNSDITVENNFVEKMNLSCLLLNWSSLNHVIRNNIFVDAPTVVEFRKWEGSNAQTRLYPDSSGHIFENNIMVCKSITQSCMKVYSVDNDSYNPFSVGGYSNNNTFVTPYRTQCIAIDFSSSVDSTLATWQGTFSEDLASTLNFTDHLWVDATKAAIDIVTGSNTTDSPTTLTPSADYYYVDETGVHDTEYTIPARTGKVLFRTHRPRLSVVVDDTYTGTAGALSGHTPDVGVAWTIESGTQAIDGSGNLTASAQGNILQTAPGPDAEIETIFQVPSVTAGTSLRFRFIGNTDCISVQLLLTAGNEQLNVFSDGVSQLSINPGNLSINTDITFRVRIEGGTLSAWVNDVLKVEMMDNATLKANNVSTFAHGMNVPTTNVHTRTRIWAL